MNNSTANDVIFGFVVKDPTCERLTEDFILNYVNSKVIDAKKLRGGVHFVDALPMTINGKVQKAALVDIARQLL